MAYDSLIRTAVITQVITETTMPDTISQGSISIVCYPFNQRFETVLNTFSNMLSMV